MKNIQLICLIWIMAASCSAFCQTHLSANAANIDDPHLILVNPAGGGFYPSARAVIGKKFYYVGIDGNHLANSFLGLAYPWKNLGVWTMTGQYFSANLTSQQRIELQYATPRLFQRLAFGFNCGWLERSFNKDRFYLIDAADPLLQGSLTRHAVNVGCGILANPLAGLFIGARLNQLNRPDLSLSGDQDKLPSISSLSLFYHHDFWRPMVSLEHENDATYLQLGTEVWLRHQQFMARALYAPEQLSLGMAFTWNHFRFDYHYDHPLTVLGQVSGGCHQVSISYYWPEPAGDFTLSLLPGIGHPPDSAGYYPGQEAVYQVSVRSISGLDEMVALTVNDLPAEITATIVPQKLRPDAVATLKLRIDAAGQPGKYPFTVQGATVAIRHSITDTIQIQAVPHISARVHSLKDTLIITEIREIHEENPLLSYIFFGENSAELSAERYRLDHRVESFAPDQSLGILDQYRNILNIVGQRLQAQPEKGIILVGCNSDWGPEQGRLALSEQRARAVQAYLVQKWGCKEAQIKINSRNLPENPSGSNDPRGREENQRVEIIPVAGAEEILAPLTSTRTEISMIDSVVQFSTADTKAEAGIQSWHFSICDSTGKILTTLAGSADLPERLTWSWPDSGKNSIALSSFYRYRLTITDNFGQVAETPWQTIFTRYRFVEREQQSRQKIDRTRLIFFQFDRHDLEVNNSGLQRSLTRIDARMQQQPQARLVITGHTDPIGTEDHNEKLALERARSVYQEFLRSGLPATRMRYEGYGQRYPLLTNELPEGRMLNRRVEIVIEYQ